MTEPLEASSDCPFCGVDIGLKPVFRASLPNRVFCPSCGSRVTYSDSMLVSAISLLVSLCAMLAAVTAALVMGLPGPLYELGMFLVLYILLHSVVEYVTLRYLRKHKRLKLLAEPPAAGRPAQQATGARRR